MSDQGRSEETHGEKAQLKYDILYKTLNRSYQAPNHPLEERMLVSLYSVTQTSGVNR